MTEIALRTGWDSLGTFGRVFRDITGENPTDLRARERSGTHALEEVPHCFVSAAHRPNLTMAHRRLAGLAFAAPEIQAAILNGTQPVGLTLEDLTKICEPLLWSEQVEALRRL